MHNTPMTTIQLKDVPEDLHRQLKARAECEGLSVPQLVLREIRKALEHPSTDATPQSSERPPLKEVLDRLAAQPERHLSPSAADIIREMRGPI